MSAVLVWLRRDLRLADNPALAEAAARHDTVIPVYIHAPEEEAPWGPGGAQRWWLDRSLRALAADLAAAGAPLTVRRGPSGDALAALAAETGATAVHWNRLYEPAVVARDRGIKERLREAGLIVQSFNAALLVEPWQVATGQGTPYRVFTPFWKRLVADHDLPGAAAHDARPPAALPGPAAPPASEGVDDLGLLPAVRWYDGLEAAWHPGEAGARARLAVFAGEALAGYDAGREHPGVAGTSALSPHLHFGEIGPRQVVAAVAADGAAATDGGEAFLRELGWREFAHHLLFHFPETPQRPLDRKFEAFPWRDPDAEAAAEAEAWRAGGSGVPLVDAAMRQLWATGWMHNRLRMVVASFWTKNLRLPWLDGARWFWDTLVDADLAANTLGWQWAGGCGADAAPYFRIFNPVRQGERFDPDGAFVSAWVPEVAALPAKHIHAPWQAPGSVLAAAGIELGRDYPRPVVDLKASREAALAAFQELRGG
ncbi:cryptochrome/photolyase family protein [Thiohalorhabdus sp.]|uniref:cryptochrome/photolyase family protein n=1 Tax=Thiohalorhabdus sp. TaxID=3094134 RepID=UPI002FC31EDD